MKKKKSKRKLVEFGLNIQTDSNGFLTAPIVPYEIYEKIPRKKKSRKKNR